MAKYRYRAIDIKRIDWERVREQVGEDQVVFSIDVAKEDFVATLMRPDRKLVETLKWRHPQQTRELLERLEVLGVSRLEAVMESSSTYGDALRWQLQRIGVAAYRVSPKRVHDAAELYDGVPSLHDPKAAYLIGRLHLEGVSQRWVEHSAQRRALQARLKQLEHYQASGQRVRNRLEALLARHWPEAEYCVGLDTVSLLTLLVDYGDPAAVAADAEAAAEQLRRLSCGGLRPAKIEALLASARTTVGMPCVPAEREHLQQLAAEALATRAHAHELERALAQEVEDSPSLAHLAAVIGKTSAVVLYCALGDPADYPDAASYLKAAGANLKERSSGKHRGQLKLTKRGPGVVRRTLYFAVLRLIQPPGPAQRWYAAKVARDGGRIKGKALTALMRKLLKALWHVGRGAPFDVDKLFGRSPARAA